MNTGVSYNVSLASSDVFDEIYDTAFIAVFERTVTVAHRHTLVDELDAHAFVQKRKLFEPTRDRLELENDRLENALIGHEPHARTVLVRFSPVSIK